MPPNRKGISNSKQIRYRDIKLQKDKENKRHQLNVILIQMSRVRKCQLPQYQLRYQSLVAFSSGIIIRTMARLYTHWPEFSNFVQKHIFLSRYRKVERPCHVPDFESHMQKDETYFSSLIIFFYTNSHIWPPPVAIFLALRVWEGTRAIQDDKFDNNNIIIIIQKK